MSKTLDILRETKKGYRDENFLGSHKRNAKDVIEFEIFELCNLDILDTMSEMYGLDFSDYLIDIDGDTFVAEDLVDDVVDEIISFLEEKLSSCGRNINVIWLTTFEAVENFYSREGEESFIREIEVGDNWVVLSDIDKQGVLFAYCE